MIRLINLGVSFSLSLIWLTLFFFSHPLLAKFSYIKSQVQSLHADKKAIPAQLIKAILIIEDKRFYSHKGIDTFSILRAVFKNLTTKRIEGASTINQQLIRNLTNEREITLHRKLKEVLLAIQLDRVFSKDELLIAYCKSYSFNKCIGVSSLCELQNYILEDLTLRQAAEIAARFKYPSINRKNYIKYLKRVRTIEKKIKPNIGFVISDDPFFPTED